MKRLIDQNYKVEEEDFLLYEEEGALIDRFAILHETWGTVGIGDTVEEAEKELIHDAIQFFQYYLHAPDHALSESEVRFTIWLSELSGLEAKIIN